MVFFMFFVLIFVPSFFKMKINQEIKRKHTVIVEEILDGYGYEPALPDLLDGSTPYRIGVVQYDRDTSEQIIEDEEGKK